VSVLIGCNGWSYEDWVGRFYPAALARKKEEWLRYYASYFPTVEVNNTFHRNPNEIMVNGWIRKGKPLKGFEYSLKMPRTVTHDAMMAMDGNKASMEATVFEETCVRMLAENGLLGTVMLQLPLTFQFGDEALRTMETVLASLETDKYRYAVEFRDRSWIDDGASLHPQASRLLSSYNVAAVKVDEVTFPPIQDTTADHAYIKLYGREREWSDDEDQRIGQDYLYSEDELRPWAETISRLDGEVDDVRVYFDNTGRARGTKNAFQLMSLLSIPHREKEVHMDDQPMMGSYILHR
jgi:uncharacterized protein YecE (DUF72 family)